MHLIDSQLEPGDFYFLNISIGLWTLSFTHDIKSNMKYIQQIFILMIACKRMKLPPRLLPCYIVKESPDGMVHTLHCFFCQHPTHKSRSHTHYPYVNVTVNSSTLSECRTLSFCSHLALCLRSNWSPEHGANINCIHDLMKIKTLYSQHEIDMLPCINMKSVSADFADDISY